MTKIDLHTDLIHWCEKADSFFLSPGKEQKLDYEVRSSASCAWCSSFFIGTKGGHLHRYRYGECGPSAPPINLGAGIRTVAIACTGAGAHHVYAGAENGVLVIDDGDLQRPRFFHLADEELVEIGQDEVGRQQVSSRNAICNLAVLSPSPHDAVDFTTSDLSDEKPSQTGTILLVSQRSGSLTAIEHSQGELRRIPGQRWNLTDWVRESFYLPFRKKRGKEHIDRHFLVLVTQQGAVFEMEASDISNGIEKQPSKCDYELTASPKCAAVFRKRGHRDYTLVAGTLNGLFVMRRNKPPERVRIAENLGPIISLEKGKTFDNHYLFVGTKRGSIAALPLAEPEEDGLFTRKLGGFQISPEGAASRPLALGFVRLLKSDDRTALTRRDEQAYLTVGLDDHRVITYQIHDRVEVSEQILRGLQHSEGFPKEDSLDDLAEFLDGVDVQRRELMTRTIIREVLPKHLRTLHRVRDEHALSRVLRAVVKNREGRTTRVALQLLRRHPQALTANNIVIVTTWMIRNLGPIDERPALVQPSRRAVETIMEWITEAAADVDRDDVERVQLMNWRRFIEKFCLDGFTYSMKRHNLINLSRLNQQIGNDLDALIYYSRLLSSRFDSKWSSDTSGAIRAVCPVHPFGQRLILVAEDESEQSPGAVRAFDDATGAAIEVQRGDELPLARTIRASNTASMVDRNTVSVSRYTRILGCLDAGGPRRPASIVVAWRPEPQADSGAAEIEVLDLSLRDGHLRVDQQASLRPPGDIYSFCRLNDTEALLGMQNDDLCLLRFDSGWHIHRLRQELSSPTAAGRGNYSPILAITNIDTDSVCSSSGAPMIAYGGQSGILRIVELEVDGTRPYVRELTANTIGATIRSIAFRDDRVLVGDEGGGVLAFRIAQQKEEPKLTLQPEWADALASGVRQVAFAQLPEYDHRDAALIADEGGHLSVYALAAQSALDHAPHVRAWHAGTRLDRINFREPNPPSLFNKVGPLSVNAFASACSKETTELYVGADRQLLRIQLTYLKQSPSRRKLRESELLPLFGRMAEHGLVPDQGMHRAGPPAADEATRRRLWVTWLVSLHPPVLWLTSLIFLRPNHHVLEIVDRDSLRSTGFDTALAVQLLDYPDYHYETLKVVLKRYVRAVLHTSRQEDVQGRLLQLVMRVEAFLTERRGARRTHLRVMFYKELATPELLKALTNVGPRASEFMKVVRRRFEEVLFSSERDVQIELVKALRIAFTELADDSYTMPAHASASLQWIVHNTAIRLGQPNESFWAPNRLEVLRLLSAMFRAMPKHVVRLCAATANAGIRATDIQRLHQQFLQDQVPQATVELYLWYFEPLPEIAAMAPSPVRRSELQPHLDVAETEVLGDLSARCVELREYFPGRKAPPQQRDLRRSMALLDEVHKKCRPPPKDPEELSRQRAFVRQAIVEAVDGAVGRPPIPNPERSIVMEKLGDWERLLAERQAPPFATMSGGVPLRISCDVSQAPGICDLRLYDDIMLGLPQPISAHPLTDSREKFNRVLQQVTGRDAQTPGEYDKSLQVNDLRLTDRLARWLETNTRDILPRELQLLVERIGARLEPGITRDVFVNLWAKSPPSGNQRTLSSLAGFPLGLIALFLRRSAAEDTVPNSTLWSVVDSASLATDHLDVGRPHDRLKVLAAVGPELQDSIDGSAPDHGRAHRQWLRSLGSIDIETIATTGDALVEALMAGDPDVIHIFCHAHEEHTTRGPVLKLMGYPWDSTSGILAEDLLEAQKWLRRKPVVFVHACNAGIPRLKEQRPAADDLVSGLLDMGASAVVAPMAPLPVRVCEVFGRYLLDNFVSGRSLGMSLLSAQTRLLEERNDPCGFLYNLYGSPGLRRAT